MRIKIWSKNHYQTVAHIIWQTTKLVCFFQLSKAESYSNFTNQWENHSTKGHILHKTFTFLLHQFYKSHHVPLHFRFSLIILEYSSSFWDHCLQSLHNRVRVRYFYELTKAAICAVDSARCYLSFLHHMTSFQFSCQER